MWIVLGTGASPQQLAGELQANVNLCADSLHHPLLNSVRIFYLYYHLIALVLTPTRAPAPSESCIVVPHQCHWMLLQHRFRDIPALHVSAICTPYPAQGADEDASLISRGFSASRYGRFLLSAAPHKTAFERLVTYAKLLLCHIYAHSICLQTARGGHNSGHNPPVSFCCHQAHPC